jgi:hypothetical protein
MSTTRTPAFGAQLIGQTEKTLNAILERLLEGSGLSEPQWVALRITEMAGPPVARGELVRRLDGVFHAGQDDAEQLVNGLQDIGALHEDAAERIELTPAGRELHDQILAATHSLTARLWGDLAPVELETAARVLSTVLERAAGEFA